MPHPQRLARDSQADELFYGGAAGGGKTDLLLGLGLTRHRRTLFLRRQAVQLKAVIERAKKVVAGAGSWRSSGHGGEMRIDGRLIEFGGCDHDDDKDKYQGQDHDLKAFDELPHFLRTQYRFITGWNRTDDPEQRCRVACGGNPPTSPEGMWVIEEWAPWLDKKFPDPARPGELRWYTVIEDALHWVKDREAILHRGERILPRSRTFIPARVQDNPIYMQTGYMTVLQSMPEPLRSQMLYGDFTIGVQDDAYQLIPTAWIDAAMERWKPDGGVEATLEGVGNDCARGGLDRTTVAKQYSNLWFAPILCWPGSETTNGNITATLIYKAIRGENERAFVNIDAFGPGAEVYGACIGLRLNAHAIMFGHPTDACDRNGVLRFVNLRAFAYWSMRELLDPANGFQVALPPDRELLQELAAARWKPTSGGILIEAKDDIKKRIGRSPDKADAVVNAILRPTAGGGEIISVRS